MSRLIPQYDIPERASKYVLFDANYARDLPGILAEWQVSRIVLVASTSLSKHTEHVERLKEILKPNAIKIGVGSHSPYSDVVEIAHLIQSSDADCVVSVGSGSYSDAVKIASKLAASLPAGFGPDDMENLVNQEKGTSASLKASLAKVVLIPTSLSGGEFNGVGSCTNTKGKKQHYGLANMKEGAADLVLCDPAVASTAPELLWLSSGVRCIDHCIETMCNASCSAEAEKESLAGLREMVTGLAEYKGGVKGQDLLRSISQAQKGSRHAMKAIVVERNSLGPSHAIGHQLGSVAHVQHGVTSAVLLGPTLKYTYASTDPVFERAKICAPRILEAFNEALKWNLQDAGDAVTRFCQHLGLPTSLQAVGVTDESQLDRIAEAALTDIWGGGEAQITKREDVRVILDMAR